MIVNIPLATGNKLNCFISAREMLSIILPCALVLFIVDFYMFIHHLLEKEILVYILVVHVIFL